MLANIMNSILMQFKTFISWFLAQSIKIKAVVILLLLVGGYFVFSRFTSQSAKPQYQEAQVVRESVISTITESGNVSSQSQTNIGSPTNGVISEVYVKNGDKVVQGQELFKVTSTATPQEQAAALATLLSAQANLNSANARINSLQSALFKANQAFVNDRGVLNPSDQQKADPKYIEQNAEWLQAEADYKNQSTLIAAAEASYSNASYNYAATQDSDVTAPIDGTVANFSSNVGSNVSASGTTFNNSSSSNSDSSSSTPVLVLGDFSSLSIKASVNEIDISKMKPGLKATISLDAFPDQTFVGKVESVDTIGTNSSGVVTFNTYIAFISPPKTITPGMSSSAIIQLDRHDDVLTVPSSAVQSGVSGSYVRVLKNGELTEVPVQVGLSSDTATEIVSGLKEGQNVVVSVSTPSTNAASASPFSSLGGRGFSGGFTTGAVRVGGTGATGGNRTINIVR